MKRSDFLKKKTPEIVASLSNKLGVGEYVIKKTTRTKKKIYVIMDIKNDVYVLQLIGQGMEVVRVQKKHLLEKYEQVSSDYVKRETDLAYRLNLAIRRNANLGN